MTDWIKHDGGPQPVAGDVEVEVLYRRMLSPCKQVAAARFRNWKHRPEKPNGDIIRFRIINQHLIDAALKRGIELGLRAAAKEASDCATVCAKEGLPDSALIFAQHSEDIRALDPETIAREAKPPA